MIIDYYWLYDKWKIELLHEEIQMISTFIGLSHNVVGPYTENTIISQMICYIKKLTFQALSTVTVLNWLLNVFQIQSFSDVKDACVQGEIMILS